MGGSEGSQHIDRGIIEDPSQHRDATPNYDLAEYRNALLAVASPTEPSRRDHVDRNTSDELVAEYKVMAEMIDKAVEVVDGFYVKNPSGGPTGSITYQDIEREALIPEEMNKLTPYQRKLVEQQVQLVVEQCAAILRLKKTMTDAKQWVSNIFETLLSGDVQIAYPTPSTINITFDNRQDFEKTGARGVAGYIPYHDPCISKNAPELRGCITVTDGTNSTSVTQLQSHEWRHRVNEVVFPEHIDNWNTQNAINKIRAKIGDPSAQIPDNIRVVEWWLTIPTMDMRKDVMEDVKRVALENTLTLAKEEIIAYAFSNHAPIDKFAELLMKQGDIYDYLDSSGLRALAQNQPNADIQLVMQELIDSIWQTHVSETKAMIEVVKQMGTVDAAGHLQLDPKTFNLLAITPYRHWKYLLATPRPAVAPSSPPTPSPTLAPAPTPTPPTGPTQPPERHPQPIGKKRALVIDVSEMAKAIAWREAEEKERELLDKSGVFRRWYVRTSGRKFAFYKEALHAIQNNKNLLAQIEARWRGESGVQIDAGSQDHSYEILDAVIRQFTEEIEYQNEKGEVLNNNGDVNRIAADLFYRHAMHPMTRQEFDEELEHRLMPLLSGKDFTHDASRKREQKGLLFANNFFELAKEYRSRIETIAEQYPGQEEKALEHVRSEMALDIQLGLKQQDLYDTKPKEVLTRFEKWTDTVEQIPVLGKFLCNPVAYGMLGGFIGNMVFRRGAKAAVTTGLMATALGAAPAIAPLIASMAVGGAFVGLRRMKELKYDRGLAIRQTTLGAQTDPNDRQRKALEQFHYDHIKAETVIPKLQAMQAQSELTDADRDYIADIMARIEVEHEKSVDLIGVEYGLPHKTKEVAMTDLRIELRNVRRKFGFEDDSNLPQEIRGRLNNRKNELIANIEENDKAFDKYKRRQGWKAGLLGAAVGGLAGIVSQFAWFKGLEAVGHAPKTESYIGALWRFISGGGKGTSIVHEVAQGTGTGEGVAEHIAESAPRPGFHDVHVDLPGVEDVNVKVPDGMNIIPDAKGDGFDLVNDKGKVVFENLHFNADGSLTDETIDQLKDNGFSMEDVITAEKRLVDPMEDIKPILGNHPRIDWHNEPGKVWSSEYDKWVEEGKQKLLELQKDPATGEVYANVRKVAENLVKNITGQFDKFGTNPDGTVDTKLQHLRDALVAAQRDGTLLKHLQLNITPTQELHNQGLSVLLRGATDDAKIKLPPELSRLFTTEESLRFGNHPVYKMELRFDGHDFATTVGNDMKPQMLDVKVHHPLIAPAKPVEAPWALPFWKRNQLKGAPLKRKPASPPAREVPPYYNPYDHHREEQEQFYRDRRSPTLNANPGARLSFDGEVDRYFNDEKVNSQEHKKQLDAYMNQPGMKKSMTNECRIAVCMPAYTLGEGKGIEHALDQYRKQIQNGTVKPEEFEIVLFLNHPLPKREELEKTLGHAYSDGATDRVHSGNPESYDTWEVVRQYMEKYPDMPIRVMEQEYDERQLWGSIIKDVYDVALMRARLRTNPQDKDIAILTNDADVRDMSETYLRALIDAFDENELDAAVGNAERFDALVGREEHENSVYENWPNFFIATRFWKFIEAQGRFGYTGSIPADGGYGTASSGGLRRHYEDRYIMTQGRNTALRGSMYAAVGGAESTRDAGADLSLGWMVDSARRPHLLNLKNKRDYPVAYRTGPWVETNPRRELETYKEGKPIVKAWDKWGAMDVYTGKSFAQQIQGNSEVLNIGRLEEQMNGLLEAWRMKTDSFIVHRALEWLGLAGEEYVGTETDSDKRNKDTVNWQPYKDYEIQDDKIKILRLDHLEKRYNDWKARRPTMVKARKERHKAKQNIPGVTP